MPWAMVTRLRDKDENQAHIQERTLRARLHCQAEYRNRVPNHPARTQRIPETASDFVYENIDAIVTLGMSQHPTTERPLRKPMDRVHSAERHNQAMHHRPTMQAIASGRSRVGKLV